MWVKIIYVLLFVVTIFLKSVSTNTLIEIPKARRSFTVDYTNNQFLKDGKPFRYISGSMHYFRVPRAYWRDRLRKIRACGLNAVETYVEWSTIEPKPGKLKFYGENDVEHFIRLAAEEDLLVILRVGPYICSERDLGGYPWWLLQKNPSMKLRTNDTSHTQYVLQWLSKLLPRIQPLLYGNGGPIIMVQVENEYASYWACDKSYTTWLRNIFLHYVKNDAVLFTTDGFYVKKLHCGKIPKVLATIDFGPGINVNTAFSNLRKIQKDGPLVNSEYYTGSLTHWGENMKNVSIEKMTNTLIQILDKNASVNFYMFVGGTNYGFTSGANNGNKPYAPVITSYHNDAPISEAGDPNESYFAIAQVVSKYLPRPPSPMPKPSPKGNYGKLKLAPKMSIFELARQDSAKSVYPVSFEEFNQGGGFLLYQTSLQGSHPADLHVPILHDRANIYLNESAVGVLNRPTNKTKLPMGAKTGQKLSVLVENQGRINYGYMRDLKGILSNVTVSEVIQYDWSIYSFPPDNLTGLLKEYAFKERGNRVSPPAIYSTQFKIKTNILDTFIDMRGWGKGVVIVNGKNLGRYWCTKGPQYYLYLPACYLKQNNEIIVFELELVRSDMTITFSTQPIFDNVTESTFY